MGGQCARVAVRRFPARRGSVGGAPAYATIAPRDSSCLFSEQRAAALAAATRSARSAPTDATCDAARVRQTRGSRLLQCAAGCSLAESCRRALDYRAKRYAIDTPRAGPSVGPLLPHPSRPRDRRSELDSVGGLADHGIRCDQWMDQPHGPANEVTTAARNSKDERTDGPRVRRERSPVRIGER